VAETDQRSMKILVLGAQGQLGTELVRTNPGHTLVSHTRSDVDLTEATALDSYVRATAPDVVINTVAFNQTEQCETEPNAAWAVNTLAPRSLAGLCVEVGARLVHFSTDFVFDGTKRAPYVESDAPNPINVYALSKYGGERFVLAASTRHLVCRTAGLYGAAGSRIKGGNFVQAIRSRAQKGESLKVVNDIALSPTSAGDVAAQVWVLLEKPEAGGVVHLTNSGGCTWFEFAQAILEESGLRVPLMPIPSSAWPGKMRRSPDTRLSSQRLFSLGLKPLRPWREALAAYLSNKSEGLDGLRK
jgi:dTDP-4-dehydrorhamnose reductase